MGAPIIDVDENLRLLGTAHVATASVEAVKQNIEEWKPDIVAVELCKGRHDALTQKKRLDREGLLKVIKEGKAPMVLLQSLLARLQNRGSWGWMKDSNLEQNYLLLLKLLMKPNSE